MAVGQLEVVSVERNGRGRHVVPVDVGRQLACPAQARHLLAEHRAGLGRQIRMLHTLLLLPSRRTPHAHSATKSPAQCAGRHFIIEKIREDPLLEGWDGSGSAQPTGCVSSAEPALEGLDDGARTCYRRRMLTLEFKLTGMSGQNRAIDAAIRTTPEVNP